MPRLLLLRHAKSSWADPGMADRDRPLSPRGRRAAEVMASEIVRRGLLPDRVLCSPSRRTLDTLAPLRAHLAADGAVTIADELYEPESGDYRAAIATHGGGARRLLVIGHNPAIQATALALAGSAGGGIADDIAAKFPTGALAVIDLDGTGWARLTPGSGRLAAFIRPRDLESGGEPDGD